MSSKKKKDVPLAGQRNIARHAYAPDERWRYASRMPSRSSSSHFALSAGHQPAQLPEKRCSGVFQRSLGARSFFSKAPSAPKPAEAVEALKTAKAVASTDGAQTSAFGATRARSSSLHARHVSPSEADPCVRALISTIQCRGKACGREGRCQGRQGRGGLSSGPPPSLAGARLRIWRLALPHICFPPNPLPIARYAREPPQVFSKSNDSTAEPAKEPAGGPAAGGKGAEASSPKPAPDNGPAPMDADAPADEAAKARKPLPEGSLGSGDVGRRVKARFVGAGVSAKPQRLHPSPPLRVPADSSRLPHPPPRSSARQVFWKSEKAFFEGTVTDFNEKLQQHHGAPPTLPSSPPPPRPRDAAPRRAPAP